MEQKMYQSFKVGNVDIKNRLVKSAMFEFAANNGKITKPIIDLYREAAEGGAGLIITGMQAVTAGGGNSPIMVQTTYDSYVDDMSKIVEVVHQFGSKVFVQLQHAGHRSFWKGGYDTFAVTDIPVAEDFSYHAATVEEIDSLVKSYGLAAKRCKEAGCDGVQVHAAHGFLINSFLSPAMNKRTDCYGGGIENRARLLFEIYKSIRASVGVDYPIGVKLPFDDLNGESSSPEEIMWVAKELEKEGVDMIEVSSGMLMDGSRSSFMPFMKADAKEGCFLNGAEMIADKVRIPVISVCGYRTPDFINHTLENTKVTAVSFGRVLVCEPDLPNLWKTNPSKAKCISCNRCLGSAGEGIITCFHRNQK